MSRIKRNEVTTLKAPPKTGSAARSASPAKAETPKATGWGPKLSLGTRVLDGLKNTFTTNTVKQNASSKLRAQEDGVQSHNTVNGDGSVSTRTVASKINATPEQALAKLKGPWSSWWKGSTIEGRSKDGSSFTIRPLGPRYLGLPGPAVNITLGKPETTVGKDGLKTIKVPFDFKGDFTSNSKKQSFIEIKELNGGGSSVAFDWKDAAVTGALAKLPGLAVGLHTRALEGDSLARDGSGLEGLVRAFE